jgi:hypothetical protein
MKTQEKIEEMHGQIQNVGLLRAALTILEKVERPVDDEVRKLWMDACKATRTALNRQWTATERYCE